MYVQQNNGLGFVATVAAIGTILSAASTGAKLFGGKVHYSPWNFLYDEYPRKIFEAETVIRQAKGEPPAPDPGGGARPTGGAQYQASMQAIVPRYVPGSEPLIAAYDRRLNEAGGAYEKAYYAQLAELARLQGQAAPSMPAQSAQAAKPAKSSGSAMPSSVAPTLTPPSQYPLTDGYGNVVDASGRPIQPAYSQAGMFGTGNITPLMIGGAAIGLLLLLTQTNSGGNSSRTKNRGR